MIELYQTNVRPAARRLFVHLDMSQTSGDIEFS